MILRDLIKILDEIFYKHLAIENDAVGLQIGKLESNIRKAIITLDITDDLIEESIKEKVDLIIAHHPLIFDSLTDILSSKIPGKKI